MLALLYLCGTAFHLARPPPHQCAARGRAAYCQAEADEPSVVSRVHEPLELTVENVNAVLEEVRPYLLADGGNVAVDSIDAASRDVNLILEGACSGCPSSTTTMRLGIERVLRERFADLGEVLAMDGVGTGDGTLTPDVAREALEQIMPAIRGLGGSVEVMYAAAGVVRLRYEGPEKIKFGVKLALLDHPLVEDVEFL